MRGWRAIGFFGMHEREYGSEAQSIAVRHSVRKCTAVRHNNMQPAVFAALIESARSEKSVLQSDPT